MNGVLFNCFSQSLFIKKVRINDKQVIRQDFGQLVVVRALLEQRIVLGMWGWKFPSEVLAARGID